MIRSCYVRPYQQRQWMMTTPSAAAAAAAAYGVAGNGPPKQTRLSDPDLLTVRMPFDIIFGIY